MPKRLFAIVAASIALGGFGAVLVLNQAGAASVNSSIVLVTPCRLVDTRPAPDHVGALPGALAAGQTATLDVVGTHGNCTIPSGATGIVTNTTIAAPTAASFLTLFPSDVPKPLSSNLNWAAGQSATPNQVTVGLSASGAINVFNNAGTVHVIIDIVAYLAPGGSGPAGPPGEQGEQGIQGEQGEPGEPGSVQPNFSTDDLEYVAATGDVVYAGTNWDLAGCSLIDQIDLFGPLSFGVAQNVPLASGTFGGSFEVPGFPGSYFLVAQGRSVGVSDCATAVAVFRVVDP